MVGGDFGQLASPKCESKSFLFFGAFPCTTERGGAEEGGVGGEVGVT